MLSFCLIRSLFCFIIGDISIGLVLLVSLFDINHPIITPISNMDMPVKNLFHIGLVYYKLNYQLMRHQILLRITILLL